MSYREAELKRECLRAEAALQQARADLKTRDDLIASQEKLIAHLTMKDRIGSVCFWIFAVSMVCLVIIMFLRSRM